MSDKSTPSCHRTILFANLRKKILNNALHFYKKLNIFFIFLFSEILSTIYVFTEKN